MEKSEHHRTTDGKPPRPGFEEAVAPAPIGPNGQHEAYWILSEEERAKGFIRPLRQAYKHVGERPKFPLRDLTPDELERYGQFKYVKYEKYEGDSSLTGRFWTEELLASGCGGVTTMGRALCETYARQPSFYGATFCCQCMKHLPVGEFTWVEDGEVVGS